MKIWTRNLSTLLVLSFLTLSAVGQAKELPVPVVGQLQGYWCWAAVSQAVLAYNGTQLQQCSIVEWTLNQNDEMNVNDVCENPSNYNWGEWPPGVQGIVTHNGVQTTFPIKHALSFNEIKSEIDNNNPIIRNIKWSGPGTHYTVVRGYDDNLINIVHIMDPGGGGKYISTTYNDSVKNSAGEWVMSMTTNSLNIDTDEDGVFDFSDNCPGQANEDQKDSDKDGIGDVCDNCINVINPDQKDFEKDGIGDACDNDHDNDGIVNNQDNCVYTANVNQVDSDGDKVGDACDNCPNNSNDSQSDNDCDGIGDACDNVTAIFGCTGIPIPIAIPYDRFWKIKDPIGPQINPAEKFKVPQVIKIKPNLNIKDAGVQEKVAGKIIAPTK